MAWLKIDLETARNNPGDLDYYLILNLAAMLDFSQERYAQIHTDGGLEITVRVDDRDVDFRELFKWVQTQYKRDVCEKAYQIIEEHVEVLTPLQEALHAFGEEVKCTLGRVCDDLDKKIEGAEFVVEVRDAYYLSDDLIAETIAACEDDE